MFSGTGIGATALPNPQCNSSTNVLLFQIDFIVCDALHQRVSSFKTDAAVMQAESIQ